MPVKAADIVKTLDIPIRKKGTDGVIVDDVQRIAYSPITKAWLDKWDEQSNKEFTAAEKLVALLGELAEASRELEAADEEKRPERQAKFDEVKQRVEQHQQDNPAPEYDFLTRQMADLLLDVGYVDDAGNPLPVNCETLANVVDRELLREIEGRIQKKLSRLSTT